MRYRVIRLSRLNSSLIGIPRLQLRKKGPAETLRSIFKHLGTAVELVALQTNKQEGREILEESNHLVCSIVSWVSDVKWHKLESPTVSVSKVVHPVASVFRIFR